MTDRARRRHPAATSRLAAAGVSTALALGLVTAMSWPTAATTETDAVALAAVEVSAADTPTADATPPRLVRVVVRRHHPVPTEPRIVRVQAPAATASQQRSAPRPAPAPAPRPRTRSGGS